MTIERSNWDFAPDWFKWGLHEIGVKEVPGDTSNPRIIEYRRIGGITLKGDDGNIPWCKVFVNAAMRSCGYKIDANAMARSVESDKNFEKIRLPRLGAVVSFWRFSVKDGRGHTGFYRGETATHVYTLEGNANDAVGINPHPKHGAALGVVGYYWPKAFPTTGPMIQGPIDIRAGMPLATVRVL